MSIANGNVTMEVVAPQVAPPPKGQQPDGFFYTNQIELLYRDTILKLR